MCFSLPDHNGARHTGCCLLLTPLVPPRGRPALQILRGLKRLILGLGKLPDAPLQLSCAAHNRSAVRLSWQAPPGPGHPAFHKYVLQRQRVAASGGGGSTGSCAASPVSGMCEVEERWEAAGEPDDEDTAWIDLPPARGSYRYRLAAWSAFGRSPYAVGAAACTVRAAAPPQLQPTAALPPAPGGAAQALAPAEMQALLAAVAAAGGNLSAGRAAGSGAAGSTWTWSAASSAAIVALSILLKASQLKVGAVLSALWRAGLAAVERRRRGAAAHGPAAEQAAAVAQQPRLSAAPSGAALRRCGSSHASLASLGSERGAGEEPLLQAAPSGGALSQRSSQQVLGSGEPSWLLPRQQLSSLTLEGSGLDGSAAAGAQALEAAEAAGEQDLQEAILRGARCAHAGCHRRFDRLRDMRRRLEVSLPGLLILCCSKAPCPARRRWRVPRSGWHDRMRPVCIRVQALPASERVHPGAGPHHPAAEPPLRALPTHVLPAAHTRQPARPPWRLRPGEQVRVLCLLC